MEGRGLVGLWEHPGWVWSWAWSWFWFWKERFGNVRCKQKSILQTWTKAIITVINTVSEIYSFFFYYSIVFVFTWSAWDFGPLVLADTSAGPEAVTTSSLDKISGSSTFFTVQVGVYLKRFRWSTSTLKRDGESRGGRRSGKRRQGGENREMWMRREGEGNRERGGQRRCLRWTT